MKKKIETKLMTTLFSSLEVAKDEIKGEELKEAREKVFQKSNRFSNVRIKATNCLTSISYNRLSKNNLPNIVFIKDVLQLFINLNLLSTELKFTSDK